ncbi:MAG: 50S ribosomal protein L14e [Candidatus Diapherotrites archaeon]
MAIEPGRICYKTRGRKAGEKVVVIEVEGNFAHIIGKRNKKERCNIRHLFPSKEKIDIKNKSQEEIVKMLKKGETNE